MEKLAPFVPLCEKLGASPRASGDGSSTGSRWSSAAGSPSRTPAPGDRGAGRDPLGHTEEAVNLVNAPHGGGARDRARRAHGHGSEDFTELVTVRIGTAMRHVEVAGTGVGPRSIPYLVGVWGEGFYLPFAEHLAVFRYTDQPGMIGRVGTCFGEEGVNIVSAAVGAESGEDTAVMALTTDAAVQSTIDVAASSSSTASRVGARASSPLAGTGELQGRSVLDVQAVVLDQPRGPEVLQVQGGRIRPSRGGDPDRGAGGRDQLRRPMARVGVYPEAPRPPCVIGYEVAGEVESVAKGSTPSPGDRVMAGTRFGG